MGREARKGAKGATGGTDGRRPLEDAGVTNLVAVSAVSALEMLDRLMDIGEPDYLTHGDGFVEFGFLASGRHVGTLLVREADWAALVTALRRHFPNRHLGHPEAVQPAQK